MLEANIRHHEERGQIDVKKREEGTIEARLLSVNEVAQYVGMGINRAAEFAAQAGARRQFGKRVLYDRQVIDKYLDRLAAENEGSEC